MKPVKKKTRSARTAATQRTPAKTAPKKRAAPKARSTATLSPEELRSISSEIADQFPQSIDDDRLQLVLLDVDPHMLHAYWNIPLQQYAQAAGTSGAAAKMLRVYLLPSEQAAVHEAMYWFDIETQGLRNQQYIDLTKDNAAYAAQYGIVGSDGRFIPLVTSNSVRTPPAGRSVERPAAFPELHAGRPHSALTETEPVYESIAAGAGEPEQHGGARVPHKPSVPPRPDILLDEEYIDGLVQNRMQMDTARLLNPEKHPPAPPAVRQPGGISSLSLLRQAAGSASLSAELVIEGRVRPGMQLVLHGSEVTVGMDGSFKIRQQLAVDDRLIHLLDSIAGPAAPSVADKPVLVMQTPGSEHDRLQLEVYASLHVYGSAVSSDLLRLFGSELSLRPDGSFHITRVLPRGACILPELMVAAQSSEGCC